MTETFYGQTVTDPYRWLESWHDPRAAQWLKGQDNYTRAVLTTLPGRKEKFLQRVKTLDTASTRVRDVRVCGGKIFYLKAPPGADNAELYVQDRSGAQSGGSSIPNYLLKMVCIIRSTIIDPRSTAHF